MLLHKKRSKLIYFFISFLLICSVITSLFVVVSFPAQINVIQGHYQKLKDNMLVSLVLDKNENQSINLMNARKVLSSFTFLQGNAEGKTVANLKILGVIPVKKITLNVLPEIRLIPSGEAIGVKIESQGLLVVGLSSITDIHGKKHSPATDAGFEVGDIILSINDKSVEKERDIVDILNSRQNNEDLIKVKIKRKESINYIEIKPIKSIDDNVYKIGLWVRDNIAGVGTMTFYDPNSGKYGALGHGITDIDSGILVKIDKGYILKSKVASVQKARRTIPGEIVGILYENKGVYGYIEKNTAYGIYGKLDKSKIDKSRQSLPIALNSDIKEGSAKILTTVEDNKIEEFDIEIQKVVRQKSAGSKTMIIKVTDERLLEKTGGIVQGMSGSPIIQDGRLIGAVTHVLINDPTRGYGISIEWMLNEANIR